METLARAANRGSISTGYDIDNSLKLEADNTEYLKRTPSSASNQRTWTFSAWVKRTELGRAQKIFSARSANTDAGYLGLYFAASDRLDFETYYRHLFITNELYRDTSAWYHIVLALDTTDGTSANRIKLYVNGAQITSFNTYNEAQLGQNYEYVINSTAEHRLGSSYFTSIDFSGYMSEVNFVDGSQLAPTDFGEYDEDSGIWIPKAYTGSYGTNGFYLDFESSGSLGADSSGNGHTWTLNNITAADQATDTPTNNFCTLNPLAAYAVQGGAPVISKGATYHNGSGGWTGMQGTMAVNKGKWYWELSMGGVGGGVSVIYGIQTADAAVSTATSADNLLSTAAWYVNGAHWIKDSTSGRDDIASGDITHTPSNTVVYAAALNMDAGEITYYANGSVVGGSVGLSAVNLDGLVGLYVMPFATVYNQVLGWNFGGYTDLSISSAATDANGYGTFEYAPPTGYYALCTKNLAEFG